MPYVTRTRVERLPREMGLSPRGEFLGATPSQFLPMPSELRVSFLPLTITMAPKLRLSLLPRRAIPTRLIRPPHLSIPVAVVVPRRAFHLSPIRRFPLATSPLPTTCPACHAPLPLTAHITPLCPHCSALLPPPPSSTSLFALFNLPPSFPLDLKLLKREFLKYQQKVHPDLFSGQGETEKWAKGWSGRVNDAFRTLEGERTRGEYLLSLLNVEIGEADSVTDPELLMAIMETREALDEATTEEQVAAIRQTNKDNARETLQHLEVAFQADPPDLDAAKNLLIQLKYLENVENVCREWSPGKRIEIQH